MSNGSRGQAAGTRTSDAKPWYLRPLRILQTVLREVDARDYDASAVVAYMQKAECNTLVVNGGGIFDFFPHDMEFASPVPFLGGQDVVGSISEACRAAGFRVILRVDFRGVRKELWARHPDWFGCDENGGPLVVGNTSLPLYAPCYESRYRNEHAVRFIDTLLERYPVDGIWHNSVMCSGICHCPRCREGFRAAVGGDIPIEDRSSPGELDAYYAWKRSSARRNLARLRAAVKSHGSDKAYAAEVFGMWDVARPTTTGIDLYDARDFFDFLVSVAFLTENSPQPRWADLGYASSVARFLKELDPAKQAVILWGGNGTSHRYVMDPPQDSRTWLWQGVSAGANFWNCLFNGQHPAANHDRRNAFIGRDAYAFIRQNEPIYAETVPVRDVALYYSKPTKDRFGGDDQSTDQYCRAMQGMERVLAERHVAYGFITDVTFSAERLAACSVLALPNVACLSDGHCAAIRAWVEGGGRLLASYKTSLCDEQGRSRGEFALSDLFGVSYTGRDEDTRRDCYQWVLDRESPLLAGMGDTDMLAASGSTAIVDLCRELDAKAVLVHVPIIVNQPPERAWRERIPSEHPTLVVNRFGVGSVVYLANQADACVITSGHEDFRMILGNAISFLLGGRARIWTDAPPCVNVSLLASVAQPGSYILSLVNTASSPYRPLRTLVPVSDIEVVLRLPAGAGYRVRPLSDERAVLKAPRARRTPGELRVKVDRLHEFLSLAIEPLGPAS